MSCWLNVVNLELYSLKCLLFTLLQETAEIVERFLIVIIIVAWECFTVEAMYST